MECTNTANINFNRELENARIEYDKSMQNLNELRKQAEENYLTKVLHLKELSLKRELANQVKDDSFKESDDDMMLTMQEAAKFLNLSVNYIYQLVYKKQIPAHKGNGRKLWFNLGELRKYKCGQWVGSAAQLADEYCKTHALGGKKKN